MLKIIHSVLNDAQLSIVNKLLDKGEFLDGKLSAGNEARQVKQNQELSSSSSLHQQLNDIVMGALYRHPEFQLSCLPNKLATAFYARYEKGMQYGWHVDDPVMGSQGGGQGRYRSDISCTVFLNAGSAYEGGELVLRTSLGEQAFKGQAGDVIVYPSSYVHCVNQVVSGVRLVAVTWVQSLVKSAEQRELLYELAQARDGLITLSPTDETTQKISRTYTNLLRMWSEIP